MTIESDVGCLKSIGMFRNSDPARLKLIALMSERMQFAAGDRILRQGQKADAVYFILSGEVDMMRDTPRGRMHALSLEKGAFFGAAAMLNGRNYPGDISAKTDVVALRMSKDLFFELIQSVPDFALAVARDLAARLYDVAERVFEAEPVG
jgi:CRP-like cAMP-binding protein